MKIIDFDDIASLGISPIECYKWAEEMIRNKDKILLPAKTHMSMPGNIFCNVMPCIISGVCDYGGVKTVTRYPKRIPSLDSKILLFNTATGEFLSLMDGNWITAMRTGAVAAHTVMNFAKKEFHTIGMIGLGNTARSTLLVLAAILHEKELHIKLLEYKDQAEKFVDRFKGINNIHFEIVADVEKVIKGSDVVISCATYFENDIADNEFFDEGILVVPVHTRGFTNCDLFFDKIYADDTFHVDHFKNFQKFKYYAQVSDVLSGRAIGRESNSERILVYNIGVSMHDIYYASRIYEIFLNNRQMFDKLHEVDMHEPKEKFWI